MSFYHLLLLITLCCLCRLCLPVSQHFKQQRSRQISSQSQILANLFTNTNYDANQRPPVREYANHPSILVVTSLVLNRIVWHTHSAEVDLNLRQDWEDSRLSFDADPREGVHEVTLAKSFAIWRPDTFFVGAQEQAPSIGTRAVERGRTVIEQSGFVRSDDRRTLRVNFQSDSAFPLRDKRTIRLAISSATYPMDDVVYLWANSPPLIQPVQVPEHLYEGGGAPYAFEEAEAGECPSVGNLTTGSFSCIELIVRFKAGSSRGLLSILLPCTLLVLISWLHFWVHSSWSVPRTASAAVPFLIFACLLLLLHIESCALRIWLLLCTLFTFLSLIEYFLVIRCFTTITTGGTRLATLQRHSRPMSAMVESAEQQQNHHHHADDELLKTPSPPGTTTTMVVTTHPDEPLIQHTEPAVRPGYGSWRTNKLDKISRLAFPLAFLVAVCIYVLLLLYFL